MNAFDAVKACKLVYDEQSFLEIANLLKCDSFNFFEDADTCVLHARNLNFQYLIFRGTFSAPGWILDARFIPTQFDQFPGRIHRGFGQAYFEFEEWFKGLHDPNATLYCAGHSLGGALATLTAWRFTTEHVYTFGCPRVGDEEFAYNYPTYYSEDGKATFKRQTRYVHDLDPVPRVPLRPFKHVCDETRIGGSSWLSAAWQHLTLGFSGTLLAALDDHRIGNYYDAMQLLK